MIRTISYTILFIVGFFVLDNLGKWNEHAILGYETPSERIASDVEWQDIQELKAIVPCDTDMDCEEKNPQLTEGY